MGDPPSPRTPEDTERAIAEADTREKAERAAPTVPPKARPEPSRTVRPDPAPAPRPSWRSTPVLGAAAVVLVTVGFLAGRSHTVEALFNPPEPSASPHDTMATIREKAFAACAQKDFGGCEMSLDEAQKSDPGGEEDPRVVRARAAILRHEASRDCERLSWDKCKEKLDQAKEMDPAGEDEVDVKRMRTSIH